MKRIFFVVALLIVGGFSLSMASTANALPALKSISDVVDSKAGVQKATYGYWHWRKHHYGYYGHHYYGYRHYGHYYGKPYYYKHYYKPYYYKYGYYNHYYPKHDYWHND